MDEHKTVIIGLDGGDWRIFDKLISDDAMPYFKRLRESGAWGVLESSKPPITPVAWVSFQTGCTPDVHGVLNFIEFDRKVQEYRAVNSSTIKVPTIWEILANRGKKVISVDVPVTYPPRLKSGFMLTGLLTPTQKSKYFYPDDLLNELSKNNLFFEVGVSKKFHMGISDIRRFIEKAVDMVEKRTDIFKYLISEKRWDLAMINFQAVDIIQHPYYCFLDESHPDYDDERYQMVKTFYTELDKAIEELVEILPEDCNLVFLSDHGFDMHTKNFHINNWLREKNYLRTRQDKKAVLINSIYKGFRRLDLLGLRNRLVSTPTKVKLANYEHSTTIDFENSKVFAQANNSYPYVYLLNNSANFKDLLIKELMELEDPVDSSRIFKTYIEIKDLYRNSDNPILPDLLFIPCRGITCKDKLSFTGSFSPVTLWKDYHIGTHREEGIYLFCGKNTGQGFFNNASITDILPTILYLMEEPIPQYMNGNVIEETIAQDYKKRVKVRIDSTVAGVKKTDEFQIGEDEFKSIEENLKNLGYID